MTVAKAPGCLVIFERILISFWQFSNTLSVAFYAVMHVWALPFERAKSICSLSKRPASDSADGPSGEFHKRFLGLSGMKGTTNFAKTQ